MPLLLYAFLNIRDGHWNLVGWAIVGFMPFYSIFAYTGFFVLVALSILWLYDLAVTRKTEFCIFPGYRSALLGILPRRIPLDI